jgi:hypothetical protein
VNQVFQTTKFQETITLIFSTFPIAITIYLQTNLKSSINSISGIPISDAKNWAECSKFIAFFGAFPADNGGWCERKPVYPMFVGTLLRFTNNINLVHLIISILLSIASYLTFTQCRKQIGLLASLPIMIGSNAYWYVWGSNQFLTESLGLLFGLFTLLSYLKLTENLNNKNLFSFGVLAATGQIIRPGNVLVFIIPLAVIGFSKNQRNQKIVKSLFFAGFYLIPFLVLQIFFSVKNLTNFQNSGNAWATIYGLANQNQGWSTAYQIKELDLIQNDYEKSQVIMEKTLLIIKSNPTDIFVSTLRNIYEALSTHLPFFSPLGFSKQSQYMLLSLLFSAVFLVSLMMYLRNQETEKSIRASNLAILISTMIFFGVSWKSDPYRAMSATQMLFVFSCITILLQGSYRLLAQREIPKLSSVAAKELTRLNATRTIKESHASISFFVAVGTIVILFLTLTLSLAPQRNTLTNVSSSCSSPDSIRFIGFGLQVLRNDQVEIEVRHSWSPEIKDLPMGYWISGIANTKENKISGISGYFPTRLRLSNLDIQSKCFHIMPLSSEDFNENLGFPTLVLENS